MWVVIARRVLPWLALAACGDPPARVRLAPVDFMNSCGKPPSSAVNTVRVIAYHAGSEVRRTTAEIADLPADTEQLGVEVVIAGGALAAIGKTAPIAFNDLPDGTALPIAMIPPNGFCRVHDLREPRVAPLVARAGDGVLVIGGGSGPSPTAEFYNPATAAFDPITLPSALDQSSLVGAVLTAMPDGRAILTGGAGRVFAVFVPETKTFLGPFSIAPRIFHAAAAVGPNELLVTGGCVSPSGQCDGSATPLHSSLAYTYSRKSPNEGDPGEPQGLVSLPGTRASFGGQLFDVGIESDGTRRLVLTGGFRDTGVADRIPVSSTGVTTTVSGLHSQVVALDGGALLTAFEPDGTLQTGAANVLPPDNAMVVATGLSPRLDRARLALLEDGSVITIGGDPFVTRYDPTTGTWTQAMPAGDGPGLIDAPVLTRLADGSVLVLGGVASGAAAWLYRPSLVGPHSGSVTALPLGTSDGILTTPNPTALGPAGKFTLNASAIDDAYSARALVGGPRITTGSVQASVYVKSGGVALIAQQLGPGRALVGELRPGMPARIARLDLGSTTTLCAGMMIGAYDPDARRTVALSVIGQSATLSLDDLAVATCDLAKDPDALDRGAWGIAAAGSNAKVEVVTITVAR